MKTLHKVAALAGTTPAPARILIVPDKFKGTLAAADVCAAIAKGWRSLRPGDRLELLPMSDGGDGFGEVIGGLLKARTHSVRTLDAAHRPTTAKWWWVPEKKLAIVEAAQVIGLAMLPPKKFHPFQLDTFGLGRVINRVIRAGTEHCVIGIGGSATNDAGFGLARALGWKFWDHAGRELEQWWQLTELARVTAPVAAAMLGITVAVDVQNRLLGPRGCSRVYGPQKGIRPEELAHAEKCLRRLSVVMGRQFRTAHATTPGAGAAGGLGFGLMTFAGARARPGFDLFAEAAQLEERIRRVDLVITGEGCIDQQTLMGKGVGQVMQLCRKLKTPCVALAGVVSPPAKAAASNSAFALTEITTLEKAKRQPQYYLEKLSATVAREGIPRSAGL